MANPYQIQEEFHVTPLTFSLLINSPIHKNIPFSPVSGVLFPLGRVKLPYAGLIVAGLDFFISFLIKRSFVKPPHLSRFSLSNQTNTLTMEELWELLHYQGQGCPKGSSQRGQTSPQGYLFPQGQTSLRKEGPRQNSNSPESEDEPLFPDNLSFSLSLSGPFSGFSETPDTSFNVPLFELPGAPGNLIISFLALLTQLFIELSPISSNNSKEEKS